ncbi:MAG: DUF362 domain-containing protein [Acidobacteria bacterium]|nr:DUF362 domain-containing protein [Acidobacteriota bacterium]
MIKKLSRRKFIGGSLAVGAASVVSNPLNRIISLNAAEADISIVKGTDYFANTIKAIDIIGGISKFVPKQSTVALLINSSFKHPGSAVNPRISLAVAKLCKDAGAKTVYSIPEKRDRYWEIDEEFSKKYESLINWMKDGKQEMKTVPVKGKALKEAEIAVELLEADVLINVTISKQHGSCYFTGTLKNMMGATSRSTNIYFHRGSNSSDQHSSESLRHIHQCIADVNLLRKPDLLIMDQTQFLVSNGPFGPGELMKLDTICAGTDPVAIDKLALDQMGFKIKDAQMITMAKEYGLGEIDYKKLKIKEVSA